MSNQLRPRFGIALAVLSIVLLVLTAVTGWYYRQEQKKVAEALSTSVANLRAGQELEASINELRGQIDRYLIYTDYKNLEVIPRYRARVELALQRAETTSGEDRSLLLQQTRHGLDNFFKDFDRSSRGPPNKPDFEEIKKLLDTNFARDVIRPAREYVRLNEGMLSRGSIENQEFGSRIVWALLGMGGFGVFGGALAGWLLGTAFLSDQHHEARLRMMPQQNTPLKPRTTIAVAPNELSVKETISAEVGKTPVPGPNQPAPAPDTQRTEQFALVGQMAAGIAHEVRNPLMAIKLLIQARAGGPEGEKFRTKDMEILQEEILRMESVITGFLNFARPPRLQMKATDIGPLVAQVMATAQARAALQGVSLDAYLPTYPVETKVDTNQFSQVLYNLIFNALDAQQSGGTVVIRLQVDNLNLSQPPLIVLQVEDEGRGIQADVFDRIFEPFVSTKPTGMGLGLSICRRIVEGHGGTIEAENRTDRSGARFTVYLPVVPLDNPSDPPGGQGSVPQVVK